MESKTIKDTVMEVEKKTEKVVGEAVEAAAPAIEAVKEKAKPALAKAKATANAAAKKAEPTVKKAKAAAADAAKKAEPTVKKAKAAAAAAGKKLTEALTPEIYVQLGKKEFTCTDIAERCKADYRAANTEAIRSCKIYIKPEDGAAYYVINESTGKVVL